AAHLRGGHLGGNCRERQPIVRKLRFLVTVGLVSRAFGGFLDNGKRDRDCGRRGPDAGRRPPARQRFDPAHSEEPAEGLICSACRRRGARRIIVATIKTACSVRVHWPHGWRVLCPRRSTMCPRNGPR